MDLEVIPYVYSGYETLVKELSERLIKKGHKVRVYCHKSLFKNKPKYVNGIELVYTPSIKSKEYFHNSLIHFSHLFMFVCQSRCYFSSLILQMDLLVFSQNFFRKKTCINVDGIEWLRPKWKGLGSIYFKISSNLSTIFFDKIITDSKEMKIIYKNRFNKNSSMIAYGPTMIKLNNSKILRKYLLKQKSYYLIVGRLIPDNNSKLIIDGFIKSKSNKKIVIVGDVPYSDYYSQLVKSLANDRIVFTGYINDNKTLSCLYKYCFGYIHGHEFGGTNPTMINALHFLLPNHGVKYSF